MDGVVKIHGKEYKTVAKRVADFRDKFPNHTLVTELVSADDERVVMVSKVYDVDSRLVSTGWAEERRDASKIHLTSSLEVCETSACGRAVAFLHRDLMGTEIASADEVANAIQQQNDTGPLMAHNEALQRNYASVYFIKEHLALRAWEAVAEAWGEISDDDKKALWVAPSKGGIFTTAERADFRSDEFNEARKLMLGEK